MSADLFHQPSVDEPFAPDTTPRRSIEEIQVDIEKNKRGGMSVDDHLNKKPRAKQVNHKARARAYFERQGYIYCPCEYRDTHFAGRGDIALGKKHDLLGIFDSIALPKTTKNPGIIGVQICSTGGAGAHARKMASVEIDTRCGTPRVVSLRAWLAAGNHALILEFEKRPKVGNQEWFPVEHWVTEETIEKIENRRRKS